LRVRISSTPPQMEIFIPKKHREVEEIRVLAEAGNSLKVRECYLNGDLAGLSQDETQRILSLAHEKSAEYSQDMIIPLTDEAYTIQQNHIQRQESRLTRLNFRTQDLHDVVENFYNDY